MNCSDKLVFPLIGIAASQVLLTSLWQQSLSALLIAGACLYFGLFWGLFQVSGGKWIGGGDVKLAFRAYSRVAPKESEMLAMSICLAPGLVFTNCMGNK